MKCKLNPNGHVLVYDPEISTAQEAIYTCECGHKVVEFIDSTP